MRPLVLKHWRDPRFWQWWWRDVASGDTKLAIGSVAAVAVLLTGFFGAKWLVPEGEPETITTARIVTIVRTPSGDGASRAGPPSGAPQVVIEHETVTQPSPTDVVTIGGTGRTVVVRRPAEQAVVTKPGETVTRAVTVPGRDRVVTNTRTETVVQSATTDRVVTVTAPGATGTVTRDVTGPTVTKTQVDTVTQPVTVTETQVKTVTVTNPLTITITLPLAPGG